MGDTLQLLTWQPGATASLGFAHRAAKSTPSGAFTPRRLLQQLWILQEPELWPLPQGGWGPQQTPFLPQGLLLIS